jgi:hypothetical protein
LVIIIIFCGEYIKEKKGGKWLVEPNKSYPSELMPVFVDSEVLRKFFGKLTKVMLWT